MSYKQQVKQLQENIIKDIKQFMDELGQDELHFAHMFQVWVTEPTIDDDYTRVPYIATGLIGELVTCTDMSSGEVEIRLDELDIYELAHIMDSLTTLQYKII